MFDYPGYIGVKSGTSSTRNFYQDIHDGRITISGVDLFGRKFKTVVLFADQRIIERKIIRKGKVVHHVVYGKYETYDNGNGKAIMRFRGDGKSKHGKARSVIKLFGHKGVLHSWYRTGSLIRQKFVYENKVTAYDFHWTAKPQTLIVKNPKKETLYEITGLIDSRNNAAMDCPSILTSTNMLEWFKPSEPFEVKGNKGRIILKGQFINRQRAGEWIQDGMTSFYRNGVEFPKALYDTPIEKLDPLKILKVKNAQVRMALMSAMPPEKIATIGNVIHKDGDMRLYDIPSFDVRILRVKCPSTKAFYFLRVPKDAKQCEPARQWTFGVGDFLREPIQFAKET